ncbi:MAG: hypothetical protein H0T73_14245 [Ardenticatenales bacterium]|nr:hypothetical protein [Ardenticatenales bacterium]
MEGAEGRLAWTFIVLAEGETTLRLTRRGATAWKAMKPFEVIIRVLP